MVIRPSWLTVLCFSTLCFLTVSAPNIYYRLTVPFNVCVYIVCNKNENKAFYFQIVEFEKGKKYDTSAFNLFQLHIIIFSLAKSVEALSMVISPETGICNCSCATNKFFMFYELLSTMYSKVMCFYLFWQVGSVLTDA